MNEEDVQLCPQCSEIVNMDWDEDDEEYLFCPECGWEEGDDED